jgi:hypothetical protein
MSLALGLLWNQPLMQLFQIIWFDLLHSYEITRSVFNISIIIVFEI